ncbi:MAG TPA: GDSL-type esterase/lipase family protein [Sporichthyaceae bacterium]|jgi:lysophospholipase L1-like esterase|nr:GDSL-type esterase/lipase family protein [Sporichthyaceae bacterium]
MSAGLAVRGEPTGTPDRTGPVRRHRSRVHVSLGDSIASGEGVGLEVAPADTWAGLLAAAADAPFVPLARGGAPVAAVIRDQLPVALEHQPDLAYVCVGLNDLFRSGGATEQAPAAIAELVRELRQDGTRVVVTRLHDPTRILPFPGRLGRSIRAHVAAINECLDDFRSDAGVHLLDVAPLTEQPECWAVDRMHPSAHGHRMLAAHAAAGLGLRIDVGPAPAAPSAAAWWFWLARHGVPWLAARTPELISSEPLRRHAQRLAYSG